VGDFRVKLLRKARYIKEDKCTGCTTCVEYCPVMVPDPFNQSISKNKAIHIYFSQAIPLITYIDQNCLYLKEKKCGICQTVCENDAIDFNQKDELQEIHVGAVILAPGYEPYDPRVVEEYRYGRFANVVTSMDYERLLSSTGPYEGEIRRPSDHKHPHKIAWVQCVGSRRVTPGNNSYCSAVCCTYTQKQVILTKDHDASAECTVFHNDIRSYGKDFERFFDRASALPNIRFIRSYVTISREDPVTKNVFIRYSTPDEGVKEEEFDLVVLSVGLNPPLYAKELAEKFKIELNSHGFSKTEPFNLIKTTRPGVFVSGTFQGPTDIPESVFTASGAVSQAGELLKFRKGKLASPRLYPEEKDLRAEEPKVGIFVCHCGANIGRIVNVPEVVEYASKLPNVVHAQEQLFSCSTDSAKQITDVIKEKGLNRVIVAACTPRTHEPTFRDSLREAGINQYYFEFANIREHCSWVHSMEKEEATRKAKDLVRMSLARALRLEPLGEYQLSVNKTALVLGGGVAGMTCALSLARQGHEVYLIEREKELGGIARRLFYTIEGLDVQAYLKQLVKDVMGEPLIHVLLGANVLESTGYVGNFVTKVSSEGRVYEIKHGATVIATGAKEYKPKEYLYGQDERVVTNLELEERIAKGEEALKELNTVVMIQCVGSRNQERNYCSRICCSQSIKNALKLKEINPNLDIYILYRDMRTYGFREDYYRLAADKGVMFVRYDVDNPPQVEKGEDGLLKVFVEDQILGVPLEIDADLVSLAAAVVAPEDAEETALMFKVTLGLDNFFKEAHVKLRPVDFGTDGVFLCGTAHYPKHLQEVINQAYGAAGRAMTLLSQKTVTASGSVAVVDHNACVSCGACITACAYGAIKFEETTKGKKAVVNPVLCKGDGLCTTKCPTGAIQLQHFKDGQIVAQLDAANPDADILTQLDEAVGQ